MSYFDFKFVWIFLSTFILSVILTKIVLHLATKYQIVDSPDNARKIHKKPVPLLGGFSIYATLLIFCLYLYLTNQLLDAKLSLGKLVAFFAAGLILMIFGFLDDKYALKAKISIWGPILASVVMLLGGVKVSYLTSWQGGVWYFENFFGELANLVMLAITFLWLLGMTYTTKVLDGLDGLVGSLGLVASFIIFLVSLSWDVSGSTTSLLSLGLAGALAGFLIWNFHPAKIFLGESGSTFIGFALGVLAILSGAKIATALLVMGLPALDVLWVIIRRLKNKQAFWQGDNQHHLHFRLLKFGLSQRQVVLLYSFLALLFGAVSIFFTTKAKLSALLILLCLMFILSYWLNYKTNDQQN